MSEQTTAHECPTCHDVHAPSSGRPRAHMGMALYRAVALTNDEKRIVALRLRAQRAIGGIEMGPSNPADAVWYEKMRQAGESVVAPLQEIIWLCDLAQRLYGKSVEALAKVIKEEAGR